LATPHTRRWFREELFIPSSVVDRDFRRDWEAKGSLDVTERAHRRVKEIVGAHEHRALPAEVVRELETIALRAARSAGMDRLPNRE